MQSIEVKDSYQFTKSTFYIMSVLMFLPHYFLITSTDFWMYKFKPPPAPRPENHDMFMTTTYETTTDQPPENRNQYQSNIIATLTQTYAITTTISLVFLILFKHKLATPQTRIKVSLVTTFVVFVISTLFTTLTNAQGCADVFFTSIIMLSTLMNISAAVTIVSLYELVTKFPIAYYAAISSGETLCGCLSALVQITIMSLRLDKSINGAVYFGLGSILLLATIAIYYVIERNSKYFIYKVGSDTINNNNNNNKMLKLATVKKVFNKFKWFYVTFVIAYGTSAIMCPGFVALVVSEQSTQKRGKVNVWGDVFFVPVITFLGRQTCSFVGRETAKIIKIPKNWKYVMWAAILRIGFIPLFLFSNAQPRANLPVIFKDDVYIILIFLFGFSEGLLVNLSFFAIPTVATCDEKELAVLMIPLLEFVTVCIFGSLSFIFIKLI